MYYSMIMIAEDQTSRSMNVKGEAQVQPSIGVRGEMGDVQLLLQLVAHLYHVARHGYGFRFLRKETS